MEKKVKLLEYALKQSRWDLINVQVLYFVYFFKNNKQNRKEQDIKGSGTQETLSIKESLPIGM